MFQEMQCSLGGGSSSVQVQEGEVSLPASGTTPPPVTLPFEPDYLRIYPTFPLSATYAIECIYTKNPDGFSTKTMQTKTYTSGSSTYTSGQTSLPNNAWGRLHDVSSNTFSCNNSDNSVTTMKYIAIKYT